MAIERTGSIFRGFTFDGEDSKDFGVYITGEGAYNAPERAVEMVSIPGRNGAFALDRGRYENIEMTYTASIVTKDPQEFSKAVSDLRNMLCSKTTYCRLTDDYNPDEYRMALYKSGLDVSPTRATMGEFDIVFECKPQRFLVSGETPVTVANGGAITNPTRYDARPRLEVYGHGTIELDNGDDVTSIQIPNDPLGVVTLPMSIGDPGSTPMGTAADIREIDTTDVYLPGDALTLSGLSVQVRFPQPLKSGEIDEVYNAAASLTGGHSTFVSLSPAPMQFAAGTASTQDCGVGVLFQDANGTPHGLVLKVSIIYDGAVNFSASATYEQYPVLEPSTMVPADYVVLPRVPGTLTVDSTKVGWPEPLYIDLDIGEVWVDDDGSPVSFNSVVNMPANLPVLHPGESTVTYSDTVTRFDVTPRWWQL